jgi:hypothetical protein
VNETGMISEKDTPHFAGYFYAKHENFAVGVENNRVFVEKNVKIFKIPPVFLYLVLKKDIFLCR